MLRLGRLEFAFELGHVRGKGSVCALENLEALLAGVELSSEIDILFFQARYPVLPVVCQPPLFVIGKLEIVNSFAETFSGGGIILGAPTVPEFPKSGLRGICWIRALPLRGGKRLGEWGGGVLLGIINALCAFPAESTVPDHGGDMEGLGCVLNEVVAVHEEGEVVGAIALLGDNHGVREQRRGPEVIKQMPQGRHGSWTVRGVKMKKKV